MKTESRFSRRQILARAAVPAGVLAAANVPALGMPSGAEASARPDPAFAAIDALRDAYARGSALLKRAEQIELRHWAAAERAADAADPDGRRLHAERDRAIKADPAGYDPLQDDHYHGSRHSRIRMRTLLRLEQSPGGREIRRLNDECADLRMAAEHAFFRCVPTTAAGAAAMLEFVGENAEREGVLYHTYAVDDGGESVKVRAMELLLMNLARALRAMAARGVA